MEDDEHPDQERAGQGREGQREPPGGGQAVNHENPEEHSRPSDADHDGQDAWQTTLEDPLPYGRLRQLRPAIWEALLGYPVAT